MSSKDVPNKRFVVRDRVATLGLLAFAVFFCLMALWQASATYMYGIKSDTSPIGIAVLLIYVWGALLSLRLSFTGIYVHDHTVKVRGLFRNRTFNASDVRSIRLFSVQRPFPVFTLVDGSELRTPLPTSPEFLRPYAEQVLSDRLRMLRTMLVSYGAEDLTGL